MRTRRVRRWLGPWWLATVAMGVIAAACGRGGAPNGRAAHDPRLEPVVTEQRWYRSRAACGQGPYQLEVDVAGARWGEEVELRVHAPRAVEVRAVVLADGAEVERAGGVFDAAGPIDGAADNQRCVADARERLTLGRTGGAPGGAGGGAPGGAGGGAPDDSPGDAIPPGGAPPPAAATPLDLDTGLVTSSAVVIRHRLPPRPPGAGGPATIRVRFWSIDPNDLEGVLFGVARIEWRPDVGDAAYQAYLDARDAAARDQARRRARARPTAPDRPVDVEAERRAERERERERERRAVAEALAAERRARRDEFCATHPDDRGCWGAGGLAVHLDLERHRAERDRYCADHGEDARCWSGAERARRTRAWRERVRVALAPPRAPDGPPPAARDEEAPPRPSAHAEWRPGYWHWTGETWFWIAGLWRVPDSDIAAGETTVAPAAPPPPPDETRPPSPVTVAVWVPGFWQWNGATWQWVPGSWQLRPDARATWRPAEWQARGAVHVLVPGGWISVGTGGR